jgi:hypothetical protein
MIIFVIKWMKKRFQKKVKIVQVIIGW